ncbi:MAG: DUF1523 family protein [Pseudomonadota bacterium]
MVYVKFALWALGLAIFVALVSYYVPQRDVVRITHTDTTLEEYETTDAAGNPVTRTRDVQRLYTSGRDGEPRVYRNADAPFYLKFDSANLTARATDLASATGDDGRWVVVTHYGWRVTFMSWFPNAIGIREASGPDEPVPWWPNVLIVTAIVIVLLVIRRIVLILIGRFVDPVLAGVEAEIDATSTGIQRFGRRVRRFFGGS